MDTLERQEGIALFYALPSMAWPVTMRTALVERRHLVKLVFLVGYCCGGPVELRNLDGERLSIRPGPVLQN